MSNVSEDISEPRTLLASIHWPQSSQADPLRNGRIVFVLQSLVSHQIFNNSVCVKVVPQLLQDFYKMAMTLAGEATPAGRLMGWLVKRNDHLFNSLHSLARSSRSQTSPIGIPQPLRKTS